ncbi:hypothetical protein PMAYCL1PPCAC_24370, partial [Pristionchus mayeri]
IHHNNRKFYIQTAFSCATINYTLLHFFFESRPLEGRITLFLLRFFLRLLLRISSSLWLFCLRSCLCCLLCQKSLMAFLPLVHI